MPRSCNEAALSLLTCMEKSECVIKKHYPTVFECMSDAIEADECRAQRSAYYSCKHAKLNMRTRIRGVRTY